MFLHFKNFNFSTQPKTIELIKILRAETNSPLNHIKKALEETNNNLDEAKVWLKKKGFKEAENRMSRSANTKLYGLKLKGDQIVVSSLSCETDFVSSTDLFMNYLNITLDVLLGAQRNKIEESELDQIKITESVSSHNKVFNNLSLLEGLKNVISKTQENCKLGICEKFEYISGLNKNKLVYGTYLHSSPQNNPFLGAKASFVVLEIDNEEKKLTSEQENTLKELADNLAMQVVASNPKYLNKADVPQDVIESESKILKDQIAESGKKVDVEKVLQSKLNSWFEDIALNEQYYVIVDHDSNEGKVKVGSLIAKTGKELGLKNLSIKEFKLFA